MKISFLTFWSGSLVAMVLISGMTAGAAEDGILRVDLGAESPKVEAKWQMLEATDLGPDLALAEAKPDRVLETPVIWPESFAATGTSARCEYCERLIANGFIRPNGLESVRASQIK